VRRGKRFGLALLATAVTFYALAYFAPLSVGDAAVFLLLVALTGQRIRPFLLVLASSVQDAPGMSYLWSYICFAGIALLLVAEYMVRRVATSRANSDPAVERLVLFAGIVVAYAIAMSALQVHLHGYPQSDGRPYLAVGGLIIVMIVTGYVTSAVLGADEGDRRRLGFLAGGALAHALLVGLMQIPFGQEFYRSGDNLAKVEMSRQLVEEGALGFARINGPFLSPNAFGYTILLFALMVVVTLWKSARTRAFIFYVIAGGAAVMLSLSKALLGYYGLAVLVQFRFLAGRLATTLAVAVAGIGVLLFTSTQFYELLLAVFRVQQGGLGSRQWVWLAVLRELQPQDWIFGVGLSAWPLFFEHYVGIALSDPHSLLLSVAGTFGIAGVLFYVLLVTTLLRRIGTSRTEEERVAIYLLLLLFLLKDLVSIPAVLGNTPLTFQVWLLLGLSIAHWRPVPARSGATSPVAGKPEPGSAVATGTPLANG
jgi:hypothetical protein